MVFFFKANCPECRILSKAKYIEAQRIEYVVEALSKSLRFLFVDFFGSSNTDHSFLGRSSKMTGGKFKRRLRLLEYNASKAAALQAASNCVDRQEDAKTADEVAVTAAEKSADGDPFAGCQREADDLAPCDTPSDDPSESQGTSPLRSGHEEKNAELRRKVKRLRDIAHHYNDEAEEWCQKYLKYKAQEEARITCLLQRHFPLSNISGYDLAQDKIIYLWDVQRRERASQVEKERKKQLAKEASAASRARRGLSLFDH